VTVNSSLKEASSKNTDEDMPSLDDATDPNREIQVKVVESSDWMKDSDGREVPHISSSPLPKKEKETDRLGVHQTLSNVETQGINSLKESNYPHLPGTAEVKSKETTGHGKNKNPTLDLPSEPTEVSDSSGRLGDNIRELKEAEPTFSTLTGGIEFGDISNMRSKNIRRKEGDSDNSSDDNETASEDGLHMSECSGYSLVGNVSRPQVYVTRGSTGTRKDMYIPKHPPSVGEKLGSSLQKTARKSRLKPIGGVEQSTQGLKRTKDKMKHDPEDDTGSKKLPGSKETGEHHSLDLNAGDRDQETAFKKQQKVGSFLQSEEHIIRERNRVSDRDFSLSTYAEDKHRYSKSRVSWPDAEDREVKSVSLITNSSLLTESDPKVDSDSDCHGVYQVSSAATLLSEDNDTSSPFPEDSDTMRVEDESDGQHHSSLSGDDGEGNKRNVWAQDSHN
jgi:hypothetical protein